MLLGMCVLEHDVKLKKMLPSIYPWLPVSYSQSLLYYVVKIYLANLYSVFSPLCIKRVTLPSHGHTTKWTHVLGVEVAQVVVVWSISVLVLSPPTIFSSAIGKIRGCVGMEVAGDQNFTDCWGTEWRIDLLVFCNHGDYSLSNKNTSVVLNYWNSCVGCSNIAS